MILQVRVAELRRVEQRRNGGEFAVHFARQDLCKWNEVTSWVR